MAIPSDQADTLPRMAVFPAMIRVELGRVLSGTLRLSGPAEALLAFLERLENWIVVTVERGTLLLWDSRPPRMLADLFVAIRLAADQVGVELDFGGLLTT